MDLVAKRLRERVSEMGVSHAKVARRSGLSERRYGHYVSKIQRTRLGDVGAHR